MKKLMLSAILFMFCIPKLSAQIKVSGIVGTTITGTTAGATTIIVGSGTTTGSDNTFVGQNAGAGSGSANTFIGQGVGSANTTGSANTFIGQGVGSANIDGLANTFLGAYSGTSNNSGNANTFLGQYVGVNNTSGSSNIFVGQGTADANTIGSFNTFVGRNSGNNNTSGNDNVFLGKDAGNTNTTGTSNTAIGSEADFVFGNLIYATAIGAGAKAKFSNTMILGEDAGMTGAVNVGIGTDDPQAHIHTVNINDEEVIFSTEAVESKLRVRAPNTTGIPQYNDVKLIMNSNTNPTTLLSASGAAPAILKADMAELMTEGQSLAIGMDDAEKQGSLHFINHIRDVPSGSLVESECMRINKENGFVGVHTRLATSASGTGEPQALFHVNLTNPVNGDFDPLTEGIRFEGLPVAEPRHTKVLYMDPATGDLAIDDPAGGSSNAWELFGNGGTTTEWIGTQDPDDFRIRTDNIQRARFTEEGLFDLGVNNLTASTGSTTSAVIGTNNVLDQSESSIDVGTDNAIHSSYYSAAYGEYNKINAGGVNGAGSKSSMAIGYNNTIKESTSVLAAGNENVIDALGVSSGFGSESSMAIGYKNTIKESTSVLAAGHQNSITSSFYSFAAGASNQINSSSSVIALGGRDLIEDSDESVVAGEDNEMYNAHGCFIGGGHNYSDGVYNSINGDHNRAVEDKNFILGNHLIADINSSVRVQPDNSISPQDESNIFVIGERINSDLFRSLSIGFNGNRTSVTTERGMSVQIDPILGATDVPVVNFEVEAGIASGVTGRQAIGTVRSNVRFHNLPETQNDYPDVVIDPATGELFRTAYNSTSKPGKDGSDEDYEALKEKVSELENQLAELPELKTKLAMYEDKFAELERSINQICEKGCAGLNTQNNDVLNQDDVLYQSVPNPSEHNAEIGYYLSRNYTQASIVMYSLDGKQLQSYPVLPNKGDGSVSVNLSNLQTGMYLYRLVVDGQAVCVKKLQKH